MKPKAKTCHFNEEIVGVSSWSIDSRTMHAFHQFQLYAEEQALELAVRLRVLGKSLVAGCQRHGNPSDTTAVAYRSLRQQLGQHLASLAENDSAKDHNFATIRQFLQGSLPNELNGCAKNFCSIERVEMLITLLSENFWEKEAHFSGKPIVSYSL